MASYESTPVDDRTDDHFHYAAVTVDEGDDCITLDTEDASDSVTTVMSVQEATTLIEALQEAVRVAISNQLPRRLSYFA